MTFCDNKLLYRDNHLVGLVFIYNLFICFMKKIILLFTLSLVSNFCLSQNLHKETLFGVHIITVELKPGATMEQFKNFFVTYVVPEYEKHWKGLRGYLVKSVRGPYKNRFAIVWLFDTEKIRDSYFNSDGTPNEFENAAFKKVQPIEEKLKQYGTYSIEYMDDWVVQ